MPTTNTLEVSAARLNVCGECGGLFGPLEDGARRQRCKCPDGKRGDDEARWPGYDFNTFTELCHCCAGALVESGSRWSSFFCDACASDVVAWNRGRAGGIPVVRHSLANGIGCPALPGDPREPEDEAVNGRPFARRRHGLWARIKYLDQWRVRKVRDVVSKMPGLASVPAYLAAVRAGPARSDVLAELASYFEARAPQFDADGQVIVPLAEG